MYTDLTNPYMLVFFDELSKHPEGIPFKDLVKNLKGKLCRKTIRKYALQSKNEVMISGKGKGVRYQLITNALWVSEYRKVFLKMILHVIRSFEKFHNDINLDQARLRSGKNVFNSEIERQINSLAFKQQINSVSFSLLTESLTYSIIRYRILFLIAKSSAVQNDYSVNLFESYNTLSEEVLIKILCFWRDLYGEEALKGMKNKFENEGITLGPVFTLDKEGEDREIQYLRLKGNKNENLMRDSFRKISADMINEYRESEKEAESYLNKDIETIRLLILDRLRRALDIKDPKAVFGK